MPAGFVDPRGNASLEVEVLLFGERTPRKLNCSTSAACSDMFSKLSRASDVYAFAVGVRYSGVQKAPEPLVSYRRQYRGGPFSMYAGSEERFNRILKLLRDQEEYWGSSPAVAKPRKPRKPRAARPAPAPTPAPAPSTSRVRLSYFVRIEMLGKGTRMVRATDLKAAQHMLAEAVSQSIYSYADPRTLSVIAENPETGEQIVVQKVSV